jgi:sugar-phosphatase
MDSLQETVLILLEEQSSPTRGAPELIEAVCRSQLKFALASNSSEEIIIATLKSHRWADCLSVRIGVDQVQHGKPEPDMFLLAASQLEVEPENCIVIEDSVTGATAAQAAGMICFAVPDSNFASHADFEEITPYLFESLIDVHQFLISQHLL